MTSKYLKNRNISPVVSSPDTDAALDITSSIRVVKKDDDADEDGKMTQEAVPPANFVPAARRLFSIFQRLNTTEFLTNDEFNHICVITGGDQRRVIQRVLMALYQRASEKKQAEEVRRARYLLSLHERGVLLTNLEAYV